MFRAKTVKRSNTKKGATGPITPAAAAPAPVTAATAIDSLIDLSGVVITAAAPVVATATEITAPVTTNASDRNTNAVSTESMLSALLDAESKAAVHKPWLRLERGLRMRLLRAYVERQKELIATEKVELLATLIDALDRKLLNSKSQITYNTEIGDIVEINSLKIVQSGAKKIFRIEPPHRSTKKAQRKGSESD